MQKLLYSIVLLIIAIPNIIGQTYYYKQVKVVDASKQIHEGDNTGQFITFTHHGCYDSDKNGIDVKNGFLKLLKETSSLKVYNGNTYWGVAYYYVTSDFNRINIKLESNGTILVYERKIPEAQILTSSLIKNNLKSNPTSVYNPIYHNPIENNTHSSVEDSKKMTKEICTRCNGTGRSPIKSYSSDYTGGEYVTLERCTICGEYGKSHYHGTCESCLGKGYNYKYK